LRPDIWHTEGTLMLTLIENGEILSPKPRGRASVLLMGDRIAKIGKIKRNVVESLGIELDVIDATGCIITPGFIDPHEHLLGGSGEKGFSSQTPEITLSELVSAGITTVVGCLGVDTTMKTMAGLLAKAKGLREEGITAFIWTGGYNVPPTTVMNSVRDDIMFIEEVIGAGEVAIADERSTNPTTQELARLANDAYIGGMLSRKAGVTHFHVGDRNERLAPLRALLDTHEIEPSWLYPTHVERSEKLMMEAIELTKQGVTVDIDTVEEDLTKWLRFFFDKEGDRDHLTISSDASIKSPRTLFNQIRACIQDADFTLEQVLPLVTSNPARVLKLNRKGRLEAGCDADLLVLERNSLDIIAAVARGKQMMGGGRLVVAEKFLEGSNRSITLRGSEA
jgi:beta-aspartyl-dipeptidase (metallo-type)